MRSHGWLYGRRTAKWVESSGSDTLSWVKSPSNVLFSVNGNSFENIEERIINFPFNLYFESCNGGYEWKWGAEKNETIAESMELMFTCKWKGIIRNNVSNYKREKQLGWSGVICWIPQKHKYNSATDVLYSGTFSVHSAFRPATMCTESQLNRNETIISPFTPDHD